MHRENVHIPARILFSHKNEMMAFERKWMELEIMLSKISQTQKDKYYYLFSHMQNPDLNLCVMGGP